MSCELAAEEMSAFLDGYPSGALEAHLAGCPLCRGELEALRKADGALRSCSTLVWTPAMTEAVLTRAKPRPWGFRLIALAATFLIGIGVFLNWPRASIRPVTAPPRDEAALFASAEHLLASGDEAGGVQALNQMIEAHPESPGADLACVALGRHHQAKGDSWSALQAYSRIIRPAVITEDLAASIKKAGIEVGGVSVGGAPIQGLDAGALRTRLEKGEPYTILRRDEVLLLGNVNGEALKNVRSRNGAAIREFGKRRIVVDPKRLTEKDAVELNLPVELRRAAVK